LEGASVRLRRGLFFRNLSIRLSNVFKINNIRLISLKSLANMWPFLPGLGIIKSSDSDQCVI